LPNESLEGSIVRIVISKFILYRRQGEHGVMLELGKDVMVLKKGGVKIKSILDFPSMDLMSCNETTKDDIGNGILEIDDEHANNLNSSISLLDESAPSRLPTFHCRLQKLLEREEICFAYDE